MAQAIRGVNNKNINISLSNYSLTLQIIIINFFTVILGLIFLSIFNFWSLTNNENLDKQFESIRIDSEEITNYLKKYALINIPEFESCEISKINQIAFSQKCLERKQGGLQLIISSSLFLDPTLSQNYIFNNYLNKTNNIRIFDDTMIKFADTSDMPIPSIEVTEIYVDKPEKMENLYTRYRNLYFNIFNNFQTYFIKKKLQYQTIKNKYSGDILFVRDTIMKKKNLSYIYKNENESFIRVDSSPIIINNIIYGVVLVSGSLDKQNEEAAVRSFYLSNFFIIIMFFMFFFSLLFSQSIISPIKTLSKIVRNERDKSRHKKYNSVYPERYDEIGILSEEIKNMSEDLKKRIDEIESFAADVSHELKNPLASLKSSNDLLLDDKINYANKSLLLQNMQKDIERMNTLITDISSYTITQVEIDDELFYKFDVIVFLKELLQSYTSNSKKIKINFEYENIPATIYANKDKLAQVFVNVIDNSLSYTPQGSEILIKQKIINKNVIIFVFDQGEGIPKHLSRKIFERFYTDRPSYKNNHSGLGLSIAKKILESFAGTIKLTNVENQQYLGACFEINLPLKD